MRAIDRSHVMHLAEAQARIPAGERTVNVLKRGTLDVSLGTLARPIEQTPQEHEDFSDDLLVWRVFYGPAEVK